MTVQCVPIHRLKLHLVPKKHFMPLYIGLSEYDDVRNKCTTTHNCSRSLCISSAASTDVVRPPAEMGGFATFAEASLPPRLLLPPPSNLPAGLENLLLEPSTPAAPGTPPPPELEKDAPSMVEP